MLRENVASSVAECGEPEAAGAVAASAASCGDKKEAAATLSSLLGRGHEVYTGVALIAGKKVYTHVQLTKVFFGHPKTHELNAYLNSREPYDKAGGYDIQGTAGNWIKKWEGDYFNVMGLPIQWDLRRLSELKNQLFR